MPQQPLLPSLRAPACHLQGTPARKRAMAVTSEHMVQHNTPAHRVQPSAACTLATAAAIHTSANLCSKHAMKHQSILVVRLSPQEVLNLLPAFRHLPEAVVRKCHSKQAHARLVATVNKF